jgi:hypothetical protein
MHDFGQDAQVSMTATATGHYRFALINSSRTVGNGKTYVVLVQSRVGALAVGVSQNARLVFALGMLILARLCDWTLPICLLHFAETSLSNDIEGVSFCMGP